MNFKVDVNHKSPTLCPPINKVFRALDLTPMENVKIVILGQDPYHGENQANGLAFSVEKGIELPPSLKNIFQELKDDLGIENTNGDLTSWALQGILLLNSVLTTELGQAGAHAGKGWELYTDTIIREISDTRSNVVFLLWGKKAQEKEQLINTSKHLVLKAPHPSPLSAHTGFLGCRHFSQVNDYLKIKNLDPIKWSLQ